MSIYLLDTSVFSQSLKSRPDERALRRWTEVGDDRCRVCPVVLAEVERGLHRGRSERRWRHYNRHARDRLELVDLDLVTWRDFARMKGRQHDLGRPLGDLDLLIAATALRHDLVVATLNVRYFSLVEGLRWEDWGT